ncbi:unnamed protein product [Lymnaea stagnalis]|uniref:ERAP1-like C-terminal domain-containing protein n=1 Tax=Lymnaea stagnalis TaxID=6523 RepID=A0AAV2H3L4_LYMST
MDMNNITFDEDLDLDPQGEGWVKFNAGQMGYYTVLYPDEMWRRFARYLQHNPYENWTLSAADRSGLLNDAFSLAASGKVSYTIPLEMLSYLEKERHLIPWGTALQSGTSYINNMLKRFPEYGAWRKYMDNILSPTIARLGFKDEGSNSDRILRSRILGYSCSLQNADTLEHVIHMFRGWLDNGTVVPGNLRAMVYQFGMRFGGTDDDWYLIWNKYLTESSPQEKNLLLNALTDVRELHLIAKLLEYAKLEIGIRRQDFFTVLRSVGSNSAALSMLWDWTRENYQDFIDRFTIEDSYFGTMLYYIVRNYNTELQLQEVKDFFAKYPEAGTGERYRNLSLESIERNIYWMKTYRPVIGDYLKRKLSTI